MIEGNLAVIGITEAKTKFSELTEKVNRTGQTALVLKHNKPWVKITPVYEGTTGKGQDIKPYGVLKAYARPELAVYEDDAWEKTVGAEYEAG